MDFLLVILIILSILFLVFQLYPLFTGYKARGKKIPQLAGVVSDAVQQKERYLLYFWAPQCGMCRGMTPIIEKLIGERDDLAKIDAAEHPEFARALGVLGTPALVLVEQGTISKVTLGAKSEKSILNIIAVK